MIMNVSLFKSFLAVFFFWGACCNALYSGHEFKNICFVITQYKLSENGQEKIVKIKEINELINPKEITSILMTFSIEATKENIEVLKEIFELVRVIKDKQMLREKRYPGVSFNRDLPHGGISGVLYIKEQNGKLVEFCSVSAEGKPVYDYEIIKLSDDSLLKFNKLMNRFLLDSEINVNK